MTLEKSAVDGRLKWTINAEGGGRTGPRLQRRARRLQRHLAARRHRGVGIGSGSGTTGSSATDTSASEGGSPRPSGKTPSEIADCMQEAGTDVSKIQACTQ